MKRVFLPFLLCWTTWSVADASMTPEQVAALPAPYPHPVNFARDIQSLLETRCVQCHGHGKKKGGFRVDTREVFLQGGHTGPAAVVGQSEASYLIELVAGFDPDMIMPQKGSRLTPEQIALLRAWIDQGMPWDMSVSFGKKPPRNLQPRRSDLPTVQAPASLTHPIDLWLHSYAKSNQLHWAQPVDDRLFIRRVYWDTVGLLPTPAELRQFITDPTPSKRQRWVARLLENDQRYATHWLAFWNDALRNDYEGTGYIDDGRKQISAWLYAALAQNRPYSNFVAELVNPSPASEGFSKGIVWRGAINASQTPEMQAAQNIAQVFMGVNLKCASCHDSFINDWRLVDAYGLANVYAKGPLEIHRCDRPTGQMASTQFIYPELGSIPAGVPRTEQLRRLAEIMIDRRNGRLTRTMVNRLWAKLMGRGLVEPLDDMEQPAWYPELLDWLAEDLADHGYDLKHTIQLILTSGAYQLPAVNLNSAEPHHYLFTGPALRRLTAEQFRDALGCITGVWHDLPAAAFDFTQTTDDATRPALMPRPAHWIWTHSEAAQRAAPGKVYFRKTIHLPRALDEAVAVVACDNEYQLSVNGKTVKSGKDYKKPDFVDLRAHLVPGTNIIAVAAVNQPTKAPKNKEEGTWNPAGFFLYARVRQAEQILDFATDRSWIWSTEETTGWQHQTSNPAGWEHSVELGFNEPWKLEAKLKATLSVIYVRGTVRASLVKSDALMAALGRPNREQVVTSRPSHATTLQALELTNGRTVNSLLQQGASQMLAAHSGSVEDFVSEVYRRALSREPTLAEAQLASELMGTELQSAPVEDFLWAVLMLPEFQLIY